MIKVRLAPSPTGPLHIGIARTALFNYLFAKQNNGKFFLRFEDTDKERSKPAFEKDIIKGLKWLGLDWDNKIIRQSERLDIYKKYIKRLLRDGSAYQKEGAIWFKVVGLRQKIKFTDLIRGRLEFETKRDKDFIIVRSDETPLFLLTNIIDDNLDCISHVIRGEDHISNTPRQIMIASALDLSVPRYAHIPLILNKDRSKMSARKDPISITKDFRDKGYLPQALINFLVLLGWNPGTDQEIFSMSQLVKQFSLKKVGKSPAIFDKEKLDWLNGYYIRQMPDKELAKRLKIKTKKTKIDLIKIISIVKDRMQRLNDFERLTGYFFSQPKYYRSLLIYKTSNQERTKKGLSLALNCLRQIGKDTWQDQNKLHIQLEKLVKEGGLENSDLFWPVRVALSGRKASPSPAELLSVFGKDQSLERIKKALSLL